MDLFDKKRDEVNALFSSRDKYDEKKYVIRNVCEENFIRALKSGKCVLVRGISGSGKTWLTKHILKDTDYELINLAKANKAGSIDACFAEKIGKIKTEYEESISASAGVGPLRGEGISTSKYIWAEDLYEQFLKRRKLEYIVFDNFETIINNDKVINELGSIITMSDDEDIQKYNTKIILVGANNDIKRLFDRLPNYETISNRIYELPEIKGFDYQECLGFINSSFEKLNFNVTKLDSFSRYILNNTRGVPQSVKDFCYQIAVIFLKNKHLTIDMNDKSSLKLLKLAEEEWLKVSFLSDYSIISNLYWDNISHDKKNNYILFQIQEDDMVEVSVDRLYANMTVYFPNLDKELPSKKRVAEYLKSISDSSNNCNILEQRSDSIYSVRNTKILLCMRLMLYLEEDEVCIVNLDE